MREQASQFVFARQRQIVSSLAWTAPQPSKCAKANQTAAISTKAFSVGAPQTGANGGEERQGEALLALGGPERATRSRGL
jgi:hypothetical protein